MGPTITESKKQNKQTKKPNENKQCLQPKLNVYLFFSLNYEKSKIASDED